VPFLRKIAVNHAEFRERLRTTRLKRDLSQAALAEAIQSVQSHVSALELGKRRAIEADTLLKLARALGVSAEWLAGED
jgi:transcriptional regulator with XRE-family HTH domain